MDGAWNRSARLPRDIRTSETGSPKAARKHFSQSVRAGAQLRYAMRLDSQPQPLAYRRRLGPDRHSMLQRHPLNSVSLRRQALSSMMTKAFLQAMYETRLSHFRKEFLSSRALLRHTVLQTPATHRVPCETS